MLRLVRLCKLDEARRIIRERIVRKGGNPKDYEGPAIEGCAEMLVRERPEWFANNPD